MDGTDQTDNGLERGIRRSAVVTSDRILQLLEPLIFYEEVSDDFMGTIPWACPAHKGLEDGENLLTFTHVADWPVRLGDR